MASLNCTAARICSFLSKRYINRSLCIVSTKSISNDNCRCNSNSSSSDSHNRHHRYHSSSSVAREEAATPTGYSWPPQKQHVEHVIENINEQIVDSSHGRLFAVIHIAGRQFKVTSEDLLLILANRHFPDVGERIVINKVLLVGGKDFTLVGRPLLENVRVEATVIEKTLSHPKIWFAYKRRKNWQKTYMVQDYRTILRINSIEIESEVD